MSRAPASFIHVDLDGTWVLRRHFGLPAEPMDTDILYTEGMPRLLEAFREEDVAATLFVVGEDVLVRAKRRLLSTAWREGHRAANHTFSHPEGFGCLAVNNIYEEISSNHSLIKNTYGIDMVGFRAPNFELTEQTLCVLEGLGYVYDGSVIGTSVAPLLKLFHWIRKRFASRDRYLGSARSLYAPRTPYRPSSGALWRQGDLRPIEFPVAVSPWLRLPVHGSYLRVMGHDGFARRHFERAVRWYASQGIPFTFLLHLSDIAPRQRDPDLDAEPGNRLSDTQRQDLVRWCLQCLRRHTNVQTTEDLLGVHTYSLPREIEVVAGIVRRGDAILAVRRPKGKERAGMWEFPGGKLHEDESPEDALARELLEELRLIGKAVEPLGSIRHAYPDLAVELDFWRFDAPESNPFPMEGQEIGWFTPAQLAGLDLCAADRRALTLLPGLQAGAVIG